MSLSSKLQYSALALIAITFLVVIVYKSLIYREPLTRGPDCFKDEYPTNVNLRFDEIPLKNALQLMAGFSCNELVLGKIQNTSISPNYTEQPWEEVVNEICEQNGLKCRTENGKLYVE